MKLQAGDTVVKKSARTVRSGCKRCGSTDVYWVVKDGQFALVNANYYTRTTGAGDSFTIRDSDIHACYKATVTPDSPTVTPEPAVTPEPYQPQTYSTQTLPPTTETQPAPSANGSSSEA